MTLALNGTAATDVYLNGTKIDKAYLNGTEVYSSFGTHVMTVGKDATQLWYGYSDHATEGYGTLSPNTVTGPKTINVIMCRADGSIVVKTPSAYFNLRIKIPNGTYTDIYTDNSWRTAANSSTITAYIISTYLSSTLLELSSV